MDTDDTDSVESYPDTASERDIGESSDIKPSGPSIPPSILHIRSYEKAKKTIKDREARYKDYESVSFRRYKRTRKENTFISRRVLCR